MAAPYCTRKPGVGDRVDVVCPDCGHWLPTHIGVDHCPVCELVDLNAQTWHEKLLSGQKSINDHRRAVGMPEPDAPTPTVTINVHGAIDGRQLVDVMEQEMLRRAKRNPVTYWTYKR